MHHRCLEAELRARQRQDILSALWRISHYRSWIRRQHHISAVCNLLRLAIERVFLTACRQQYSKGCRDQENLLIGSINTTSAVRSILCWPTWGHTARFDVMLRPEARICSASLAVSVQASSTKAKRSCPSLPSYYWDVPVTSCQQGCKVYEWLYWISPTRASKQDLITSFTGVDIIFRKGLPFMTFIPGSQPYSSSSIFMPPLQLTTPPVQNNSVPRPSKR